MNAPESPATLLIPLTDIIQSPSNPRKHIDQAKLDELASSIKAHGVLQPILVRRWQVGMHMPRGKCFGDMQDKHEIVCGERRWRASQIAGMVTIPALVLELTDKQVLELQVVENLQREDVHPIEEAEGYERLIKYHDYTADTLAEKIGKSRAYIYARLKLTALAPAARDLFYDGKLTASNALLIARIPGTTLQVKAAGEITTPDWQGYVMSYRRAAEYIQQHYMLDLEDASFKMDDAALVPKAGSCDACPKRSGNDLILFADIGSPNVCTDPPCFQNKKEANYLRLKALAEKSGKEIISGKEATDMLVSGRHSLAMFNLANIDDTCHDDQEHRTYREILGKAAPVITYVEDARAKAFIEAVDTKLLAGALKKAGIEPTHKTVKTDRTDRDYAAERIKREEQAVAENTWRGKLFQAIRIKLRERFSSNTFDRTDLLPIITELFRQMLETGSSASEELISLWGLEIPDPESSQEDKLDALNHIFDKLMLSELLLLLTDITLIDDTQVGVWAFNGNNQPEPLLLLAQAARLGIDAEALREPKVQPKTAKPKAAKSASTPSKAAQAKDIGAAAAPADNAKPALKSTAKKAKANADPAPALPANEPAAPVKTGDLNLVAAWPFPRDARV